jgi:V8-like Glu-specific endopeptidase
MKSRIPYLLYIALLCCGSTFAQAPTKVQEPSLNQWKKAVVKIESIQQRYNFAQADVILHKQIDGLRGISQHDTYSRQDSILTIKDTIRGTGIMISDGNKIYLVTAKHLVKATEKLGNGLETINDLLSIKTDADNKKSNDISLMNLATNTVNRQPFMFSDDKTDLGIISFQKSNYKMIVAYLKQVGCVPVPIQSINNLNNYNTGDEISTIGFPALHGSKNAVVSTGKIELVDKSIPDFTAAIAVYPGNSGGPVIKNNKLVGVLSYQAEIANNIDAARHSFAKSNSAAVIKGSYILPLLRKLQEHEKNPGFNN